MLGEGNEIGGIRLERLLGRGAMGEVYRGVQLSLKRPVAVKRIADHLVDEPEAVLRFEREAQVVARLQSQNVVQVFDFIRAQGPDGKQHCLIVMELIEGGASLRDALKANGRFSWQQAASLALQSAEGLAAAAEFGVIHRDVKPDNIMLTRKGVAKLADFGLARAMDSSAMTQEGALLGTPNYIAPEGCRGEQVDHRADLYSLGATWYHLATGQPPFKGDNLMALLRHHLETPAPDVRELAPDTPEPIAALIAACLAKVPNARPASAQVLAERLQALAAEGLIVPRVVPELVPAAGGDADSLGGTAHTELAGAETMPSGAAATLMAETAATALDGNQATAATRVADGDDATMTAVGDGVATAATAVAEQDPALTAAASDQAVTPDPEPAARSAPEPTGVVPRRTGWRSVLLVTGLVLGAGIGAAVLLTRPDAPPAAKGEPTPPTDRAAQPEPAEPTVPVEATQPIESPPVEHPILVDVPEGTGSEAPVVRGMDPGPDALAAARIDPASPADSTTTPTAASQEPAPGTAPAAAAEPAVADSAPTAVDQPPSQPTAPQATAPGLPATAVTTTAPEPADSASPEAIDPGATAVPQPTTVPEPAVTTAPEAGEPMQQQRPAEDPDIGTLTSIYTAIDGGQLAEAELWLEQLSPDHPDRPQLERAVEDLQLRGAGLQAATANAIAQEQWGRAERLRTLVVQNEPKLLLTPALRLSKPTIDRGAALHMRELDLVRDAIVGQEWLDASKLLKAVPGDLDGATIAVRARRGELAALLELEAGKAVDAQLSRIDAALEAGETTTARRLLEEIQNAALVSGRFDVIKARRLRL